MPLLCTVTPYIVANLSATANQVKCWYNVLFARGGHTKNARMARMFSSAQIVTLI